MPLGTLQHNAELVKRNFINLRTVWGSLFHLRSPMSLSYYSSFHLWLFLFSPHDSLLSWFVFPLLKTIFFSCSLCHTFSLHLLLSFFLWSFPFIPGHCHPQFLWSVFLGLHFSPLHFPLTDVFSPFIFASLRKLSSFTLNLTHSYSPFFQSFPFLHYVLFPHTPLPCKLSVSLPTSYSAKCHWQSMDVTTAAGATAMAAMFTEARLCWKEALLVHKLTHGELLVWLIRGWVSRQENPKLICLSFA